MIGALAWRERTKLAWAALGTVLAQAALGGVLVRFLDPAALAIAHAALAQLCFGLVVAVSASPRLRVQIGPSAIAAIALFAQTILGAPARHHVLAPIPPISG